MAERLDALGDAAEAGAVERWLQALTTLELAEAHLGPRRSGVVDRFRAEELAARLALQPSPSRPRH